MEHFLSWDILLTYGGCVTGTVLVTEWLKKVFAKVPAQIVSFIVSLAILIIGHIATGTFAWAECFLYLINSIAVSLAANGSFDALKKAFGKEQTTEELVIDMSDPEKGTYLNLSKNPEDFTNGETVAFKVTKVSQD